MRKKYDIASKDGNFGENPMIKVGKSDKNTDFMIDLFLQGGEIGEKNRIVSKNVFPAGDFKRMERFNNVCEAVKSLIRQNFTMLTDEQKKHEAELQKSAIIGDPEAVNKLRNDIRSALIKLNLLSEAIPDYYREISEAVFNELYGLAGIASWAEDYTDEYARSPAAKLIGDRFFCMIDGKTKEQSIRIDAARREQLRRALLLAYPRERLDSGHNEVYIQRSDGGHIRATLLAGEYTEEGKDVLVLRKYLLSDASQLTFENLASHGTFPYECCELFEAMVRLGVNVFFVGEVRSGKSTFLETWQHYEDPTLEGTAVSSDAEIDYSAITPRAPIVQIIADDKKLDSVEKSLKRLDSNYIVLSEVRGAAEYRFFLGITNMGTRRCKCTIHDNNAVNFPYKMAAEITAAYGGDQQAAIAQLYSNIDFAFELCELPSDRSRKRLKGIVEFRYDTAANTCSAHRICEYESASGKWRWKCDIGDDKRRLSGGDSEKFDEVIRILKELEEENPLEGETVIYPAYYAGNAVLRGKT